MHTPIWRDETVIGEKFCKVSNLKNIIEELTKDLANVTVIDGFDLVPGEKRYFADFILHPNDKDFEFYYENLAKKIKEKI